MNAKYRSILQILIAASSFLFLAGICSADTILNQLNPVPGGFWIGSIDFGPTNADIGPNGLDNFVVAQTFQTDRSYANVTAVADLFATGYQPYAAPVVSFTVSPDDNGVPGSALASVQVSITSDIIQAYNINFNNLSLQGGMNYWLVASSNAIMYGTDSTKCCSGAVPVWESSSPFTSYLGFNQNDKGWYTNDGGFAVGIYGTATSAITAFPSPISLSLTPGELPEPSSLDLMAFGITGLLLAKRRRRRGLRSRHR